MSNFPSNPSTGATFNVLGKGWIYDGYGWAALDDIIGISAGNQIAITITGQAPAGPTYTIDVIDGATSDLHAGVVYGVSGSIYASSLATGLLHGGIITINAGNSAAFDITSGSGQIHSSGSTYTADPQPTYQYVTWPAQTGITLQYLSSSDTTWIYIDSSGTVQQRSSYYTDNQLEENIIIGQLVHPSRTFINLARTNPNVAYATDKQYEQFIRIFGPVKGSGHTIQPNGANLKLNRTSGTAFSLGRNWINDTNNPSVVSDGAYTDCIFYRYYRGATAGTFITVPNQTAIDPTNYDDGSGTLQSLPGGKYSIQRIFYYPNTPSLLGVYYGRAQYTSLAEAAANINFEDFTEIENTRTNAIFVATLIVKSGATDLTNTNDALILQAGAFRSTISGGGSVATKFDDLTDVVITGVQDDQIIIYNSATSQWENTNSSHVSVTSYNGRTGAVQGVSAAAAGSGISVSGATGAVTITNTGVQSFNGSTGTITGVSSIRGLTGAVGITNGSGIGLSVSGQTMTFSNTGVLSIDGGTGAITYVARTNVANTFTASQTIEGLGRVLSINDANANIFTAYSSQLEWYNDLSSTSQYWVPSPGPNPSTITFPNENGTIALTKNVVSSFNGLTGAIVGVNSVRGLTGAVGITNGSGIGLSVSGQTMTFSNTGVLSINGSTGAITNVARTNVDNFFNASQTISAANAVLAIVDSSSFNEVSFQGEFNRLYFYNDLSGGEVFFQPTIAPASTITVSLPDYSTTLAGLAGTQIFTGTNTFSALTNFPSGISAAGATFSSLVRFNAGISASGGITFNSDVTINLSNNLNVGGIQSNKSALEIDTARVDSRVAMGDYTALGNSTFIYLRNATSELQLSNPFGVITIGDPDGYNSGYFIGYDASNGNLYGNASVISDFSTISSNNGFYETANSIRVTNNARSWFL
jgi:hypothetical protein